MGFRFRGEQHLKSAIKTAKIIKTSNTEIMLCADIQLLSNQTMDVVCRIYPTKEKYFPFLLSVAMIILSVLLFFLPSQHTTSWPQGRQWLKIGLLIGAILFYSLFLSHVGFLISASLLMAVCMWEFGAKLSWIIPVSVTVAISFYIIFDRILGLNLPAGILNF